MYRDTITLLGKKIKPYIIPVSVILIIIFILQVFVQKPKSSARAASDGVGANFANKFAPLDSSSTWEWTASITATKHIGESVPIQYGVYWCKTSSGQKGEGKGSPCAADITPDDFFDTLIFENKHLLVQPSSLTLTHRGVNCGRVQIDIGGLGGILGGDTYDTGVSCTDRNIPVPTTNPNPTIDPAEPTPVGGIPRVVKNPVDPEDLFVSVKDTFSCIYLNDCQADSTNDDGTNPPPDDNSPAPTLDFSIPFRDTSVQASSLARTQVAQSWPHAKMEYWDTIVSTSIANGWNPAFVLSLWVEETGGSTRTSTQNGGAGVCVGACSTGHVGCNPGENQDINRSLQCIFNGSKFKDLRNDQFDQFMRNYCGPNIEPICDNNRNFIKNIKFWYSKLVPSGPGALTPK